MEVSFLSSMLSLLFLLTISTFTFIISKKINFPYTVLLVIVGLILVPLSSIEVFSFINNFELTPDILFFVFLPVLLFESSYNINYRHLIKNWKIIGILAVFGLLISAIIIAIGLFYLFPLIGFNIPFMVCLLFGTLISATDPVAVLSIFKSIGAPKRLALIFEGESLFNDGTALAVFLVILGVILEGTTISIDLFTKGFISFISMVIGGIIFGGITGVLFSKIIGKIKNNESVEITLTMILAHLTFILAEFITHHVYIGNFNLQISGVIATVIAGIIIGNYGRYKISPKVEYHMERFWEFFAFVSNSLVFILMGLILSHIEIDFFQFILPITLVIIVIIIARGISIYLPIGLTNITKIEQNIPLSWQHILSWGSLRGALALMMALMIPGEGEKGYDKMLIFQNNIGWNFNFDVKDFIIVITIGAIMFTLLIKATTIAFIMKKLGVTKLNKLEKFEYGESKILANIKIINKLNKLYSKSYLTNDEYMELKNKYNERLNIAIKDLTNVLNEEGKDANNLLKRAISLHALGVEKQYLKILFSQNEISENNFHFILRKISRQKERLESGNQQLKREINDNYEKQDIFEKIISKFREKDDSHIEKYIRNRARVIITRKVLKELNELLEIDFGFDKQIIIEIISLYQNFHNSAKEKMKIISKKYKSTIMIVESRLTDKTLINVEEEVIEQLYKKEIITPKLYIKFMDEIEKEIYMDIKKGF